MWDVFQNSGSKQICPFPPVMDNLSWGLNECGLTWHQLKLLFEWAVVEYKVWFPQKGSNILDSLVKWNHQELGADLEATPRQCCPGHFCGPGFGTSLKVHQDWYIWWDFPSQRILSCSVVYPQHQHAPSSHLTGQTQFPWARAGPPLWTVPQLPAVFGLSAINRTNLNQTPSALNN